MLQFLSLPTSLLFLIASTTAQNGLPPQQWPYNLPPDVRYYPEDEQLIRRDLEIGQRLLHQSAAGVRKMTGDEGEKFFMDYWQFEKEEDDRRQNQTETEDGLRSAVLKLRPDTADGEELTGDSLNGSSSGLLRLPFPMHSDAGSAQSFSFLGRYLLGRALEVRSFQCPTGTDPCTSIGKPNSCCATGETCQIVTNTVLGDVGCCAAGETCGSQFSQGCDSGLTSCPSFPGGGCCIPGYACLDYGCVLISTATVVVQPTTVTVPKSSSSSTSSISSSSSTSPRPTTRTFTSLVVVPPPSPTTSVKPSVSSSASTTPRPTTCPVGLKSCPASVGGGCCATDRICTTDRLCVESTTSSSSTKSSSTTSPSASRTKTSNAPVAPPLRPTSISPSSSDLTIPGATCPTGFYACSAYYRGGCCRTGRNCDTTSCPPTGSTTVVDTNSITAVAPTGSGISGQSGLPTGNCAQGWFSCAPSVSGGCCPSGYACGTACTATASGGSGSVGKIAPNGAEGKRIARGQIWSTLLLVIGLGIWFGLKC